MRTVIAATLVLVATACSSSSAPSSFGQTDSDGGSGNEGGRGMEAGNLLGEGGSGSFPCGAITCDKIQYCVFVVSETGGESANCYPLNMCGDCACVMGVVAAQYCVGDTLTCTPSAPISITCTPQASPTDAGSGG
jgi:hypothetical protein